MSNKNQPKDEPSTDKFNGHVKIPIKDGFPDFEGVTGNKGTGKPLSFEQCMGIISLGYQYWQTKVAGRAVLMMDDEITEDRKP